MWPIEDVHRRRSTHGHGDELVAEGIRLSDDSVLVRWHEPDLHLFHCEYCGGDDYSGGWVSLRRAGTRVVWLPSFDRFADPDDGWARDEYAPPYFMIDRGIPVFEHARLGAAVRPLPPLDAIPALTTRDVVLALQFESVEMLGRNPAPPAVERPWVVSSTEPSLDAALDAMDDLLREWLADARPVELRGVDHDPVCFWVEPQAGREWCPLARLAGRLLPRFEPRLIAWPLGTASVGAHQ